MKKKAKTAWFIRLRWTSQTIFMLLFLWLFYETAFHFGSTPGRGVDFFFNLDPLAPVSLWAGGHPVAGAMLLSLITLAVTLVFGRWFCGWFCPFGTLHNLVSSWRGGNVKSKITEGGFTRWQHGKYLVLLSVLVAALVGANLAGWFDPFSFFYRSLALAIFPAFDAGLEHFFAFIFRHDINVGSLHVTSVSEPVYRWLHHHLLTVSQPRFLFSTLFGTLIIGIAALNLLRSRFWCKYICPLGAMLGVVGKNPMLRLHVDESRCNSCGICVSECQGAASPDKKGGNWKPSECMYCLNCQAGCPSEAISFRFFVPGSTIGMAAKRSAEGVGNGGAPEPQEVKQ